AEPSKSSFSLTVRRGSDLDRLAATCAAGSGVAIGQSCFRRHQDLFGCPAHVFAKTDIARRRFGRKVFVQTGVMFWKTNHCSIGERTPDLAQNPSRSG